MDEGINGWVEGQMMDEWQDRHKTCGWIGGRGHSMPGIWHLISPQSTSIPPKRCPCTFAPNLELPDQRTSFLTLQGLSLSWEVRELVRVDRLDRLDRWPAGRFAGNASSCLLTVDFGSKPDRGGVFCSSYCLPDLLRWACQSSLCLLCSLPWADILKSWGPWPAALQLFQLCHPTPALPLPGFLLLRPICLSWSSSVLPRSRVWLVGTNW